MARPGPEQELLPSVLDRLIEPGPRELRANTSAGEIENLPRIKDGLRRDLEWLLNTRKALVPLPTGATYLEGSVLTFGLPDFTNVSLDNGDDRRRLVRAVEEVVRRFEPRLNGVVVTLLEGTGPDRALRFRIDGMLRVEPNPEPITFDSVLRLPTRDFVIEES